LNLNYSIYFTGHNLVMSFGRLRVCGGCSDAPNPILGERVGNFSSQPSRERPVGHNFLIHLHGIAV